MEKRTKDTQNHVPAMLSERRYWRPLVYNEQFSNYRFVLFLNDDVSAFMIVKGKKLNKENIRNILLIQLGDIGDVVYSLPCAKALKEAFSDAAVVLAVRSKASELVEDSLWIDGVIAVDNRKRGVFESLAYQRDFWNTVRGFHFDLAVDLRTGTRGAILAFFSGARQRVGRYAFDGKLWRNRLFTHLVLPKGGMNQFIAEYYLDTIAEYGVVTENLNPEIHVSEGKSIEIAHFLQCEGVPDDKPIFAIQPFSLWGYKEWAIPKYVDLIERIIKKMDISIIITGAPNERERSEEIARPFSGKVFNLTGKTPLNLLPALYKKCELFLGLDSAGVHIAAAVGTPTVSLYGPSSPETWAPKGEKHIVIRKNFPCVPCKETGCQGSMKSRCMDELTVDEVVPVVEKSFDLILQE